MDPTQKCVYCGGGLDFGGTIVHQPNCPSWRRSQGEPPIGQEFVGPEKMKNPEGVEHGPFMGLGAALKPANPIENRIREICREEIAKSEAMAQQYRMFVGGIEAKENHDWRCGCSHWNGPNLYECAQCRRKPGDAC